MELPLPILGNLLALKNASEKLKEHNGFFCEVQLNIYFNYNKLPPMVHTHVLNSSTLIINDPEILNEIYLTKSKYIDKH